MLDVALTIALAVVAPALTVDSPADGATTSARTIVVQGTAPAPPRGDETEVVVTVGDRPVLLATAPPSFRIPVALALGHNDLDLRADIYGRDDDDPAMVLRAHAAVTRVQAAGDATGTLDRATAYLAADLDGDVYELCMEACAAEPHCFSLGPRRVDCPVSVPSLSRRPATCGLVLTVRLRGRRVYVGEYACRGRFRPDPRRFIRREVYRRGRRFTVAPTRDELELSELDAANRYGVPRFDAHTNLFVP
jgi:hypothetical protein